VSQKKRPQSLEGFEPKTELVKKLLELRRRIVASGEPLLDWDDVQREALERRFEEEASSR
jgi:hypothetical protein